MSKEQRTDFDKKAASWDDNPLPVKLAGDIARAIASEVGLRPEMDVLDFGCGTGLLALQLRPQVRSITGVDSSAGMLEVFKKKVLDRRITGVELHHFSQGARLKGRYHLAVTSMTLHHVKDVKPILDQFQGVLCPSGCLCIADLDLEGGRFHDSQEGIFHFGFDRESLRRDLLESGFVDVRYRMAAEVTKVGSDGVERKFTVFLIIARKG